IHEAGAAGALHRVDSLAADDRTFDILEDFLVGLALIMMRVDVDDQEILIVARARLLAGVSERLGLRELVGGDLADFVSQHVHGDSPSLRAPSSLFSRSRRTLHRRA